MSGNFNSRQSLEENLKSLYIASMAGNKEAYTAFLELCSLISKKYLNFLGGKQDGSQTLEDIAQEVLLSIHEKKHTYHPERPILPWLYAIVRHRYIDFYRAQKRAPRTIELTDEMSDERAPLLELEEILAMLSPRQRELLLLVKVDGATYGEAAQALNLSLPSVKVNLHRILKTLKDKVGR